jgi:predicted transglutaminase-like cysteine proteinase
MNIRILIVAVSILAFTPHAETNAGPSTSAGMRASAAHLDLGGKTGTPRGYFELCRRGHAVCRLTSGAFAINPSGLVKLTDARLGQLMAVNTSVNRQIRPVSDGVDTWTIGGNQGDCEDYAITKKEQLMGKGWPASALLVALAQTNGQQHAVLVVRTTVGDLVLDNLRNSIVGWNQTGYHFDKIQSPQQEWIWLSL